MSNYATDYIDVASRLVTFREKHPEGSLQPVNPDKPIEIMQVGDKTFLAYLAAAYRHPEDPRPGIGVAWEPIPGRSNYTRDSEAMVAETSAWGRAIVAVLAADTKAGIASADEVANRTSESSPDRAGQIRSELAALAKEKGYELDTVASDFSTVMNGTEIATAGVAELSEYKQRFQGYKAAQE